MKTTTNIISRPTGSGRPACYRIALIIFLFSPFSFLFSMGADENFAVEFGNRRFGINDGLPETLAWQIYQDSKGFVWTGTYGGFAVYDGQKFTPYWNKESMNVLLVTETPGGSVAGVSFWDYALVDKHRAGITLSPPQKTFRLVPYMGRNLPKGYAVFDNREAGGKAIVCLSDTGHREVFVHEILSAAEPFRKPYWDTVNKQFYFPSGDGVFIVNENGQVQDSIAGNDIFALLPYKNTLWGVGEKGIYRREGKRMEPVFHAEFLYDYFAGLNLMADTRERLIIQSYNAVYRFDGSGLETLFGGQVVYDMIIDRENSLWIAAYDGVYNCFGAHFRNYFPPEGENLRSVTAGSGGGVWLATEQGNIYKVGDGKQAKQPVPAVKDVSFFNGVPAVSGNNIYFPGCYKEGDVLAYENGRWRWMGLPASRYIYAEPLANGNLLFLSLEHVIIATGEGKIIRKLSRDELGQQPACAIEGPGGKIYVGGSAGIALVDGDTVTMLRSERQGAHRCIAKDGQERIWASRENKLFMVEADSLIEQHSFDQVVRNICFTRNNILLAATLNGIYIRRPNSADFLFYGIDNGFTAEKPIVGKMAEQADGRVWLITSAGAVSFHPEALLQSGNKPLLYLESGKSSGDNIHWEEFGLDRLARLDYKSKNVRFHYIGLCYSAAGQVKYQYRLAGFQDEWSEPVTDREISFNNLPPGNYMFQLKARAGNDDTETAPLSYSFTIRPAFWQTLWFIIVAAAIFTSLVVLFVFSFLNRKNQEKLRLLERQKQLNLYKIQSIRLRSIPHFNANVLAGIEYHIMNFSKEEANHYLAMYSDFTNTTLRDVDLPSRPVEEEVKYIGLYLGLEQMRFGDDFRYTIEIEPGVDGRIQVPNMLLHTHCENALKHGLRKKKGEKLLGIRISPLGTDRILICIDDNGIGRKEAARQNTPGTRQGLYILSRQIELYNQTNKQHIEQRFVDKTDENGNNNGTLIEVIIPVGFIYN